MMDRVRDAVKDHVAAVDRRLHETVGTQETIVISYDGVQFLFDVLWNVFYAQHKQDESRDAGAPTRSAFHGLTALMPSLLDEVGWRQSMCGTSFQISAEAGAKLSSIAHRVQSLYHVSTIAVDDMKASLETFFPFPTGLL
eukprot:ANDGO_07198.mRNA.1 hypothetical protein